MYGEARGCGSLEEIAAPFGVNRPCGNTPEGLSAPNHFAALEYYGRVPAPWLTPEDIAEIEAFPDDDGPWGLQRYGLIAGKFIRHHLEKSGATHVNLACHSMGCLISRYLIENDIEGLASENRFVRWVTSAGVIGGARLARLYDNPQVQQVAPLIGLELADFILMNPDWVQEHAARWDHRLQEGNNPLFRDMLIHHGGATDRRIEQAFNVQLLDLNNPGSEPNDGIMYTLDQFFHRQNDAASRHTPSGRVLSATHNFGYLDHMNYPDGDAFRTASAAALFHRRKVVVKLEEITLHNDREVRVAIPPRIETGQSPAEISVEVEVRYDPYVATTLGRSVLVHEATIAQRTPDLFVMEEGKTERPEYLIYAGPIFDAMTEFQLDARIVEVDRYPRMGVEESLVTESSPLVRFEGAVPLHDHVIEISSQYASAKLSVEVVELY